LDLVTVAHMQSFVFRLSRSCGFWPALIALAAAIAILPALDPAGDHQGLWDGPGLTVDEPFNVGQGVMLADRLLALDLHGYREVDARLPDHPPLGRLAIGLFHEAAFLIWSSDDRAEPYSVACARTASAAAFALTVFLVGLVGSRWYGRPAGAAGAAALVLMPRVFGHAHLAALETSINLACTVCVLYLADRWSSRAATWRTAAIGGLLFGLALLTKIQAILLVAPVTVWALLALRGRAVSYLALWGAAGLAVFFIGWPHLWDAPWDHLQKYLGRTTDRATIYAWYGGAAVADRDLPWHYPWVMVGATVPIGLGMLALWGSCAAARTALRQMFAHDLPAAEGRNVRDLLPLAWMIFPICLFSLPGIAVYDGERLMSVVFPMMALFAGRGAASCLALLQARMPRWSAAWALGLFLAVQGVGLVTMAPCWLSYYNLLVGGLSGAERMGLPVTYWGDGITRSLLAQVAEIVPPESTIAVAPVLYSGQWNELLRQSPALGKRGVQFVPCDDSQGAAYLLFFSRREYLPEQFRGNLRSLPVEAAIRRNGVILAALVRLSDLSHDADAQGSRPGE
jgi:hypothetical protein